MPTNQGPVVSTQELALSDLYARAVTMARRLGSSRVGANTGIQETRAFQLAWNQSRGETSLWFETVGLQPSPAGVQLLQRGMTTEGIFGEKTALALAMLLYAAGLEESVLAQMPTSSPNFPLWYAPNQSVVEGTLLNVVQNMSSVPGDSEVPVEQTQQDIEDIVEQSREAPETINEELTTVTVSEEDMVFESGSTIQSAAGRKAWDVPIWAIGLGVLTAGGLIYAVAKRKKRSAEIRA